MGFLESVSSTMGEEEVDMSRLRLLESAVIYVDKQVINKGVRRCAALQVRLTLEAIFFKDRIKRSNSISEEAVIPQDRIKRSNSWRKRSSLKTGLCSTRRKRSSNKTGSSEAAISLGRWAFSG